MVSLGLILRDLAVECGMSNGEGRREARTARDRRKFKGFSFLPSIFYKPHSVDRARRARIFLSIAVVPCPA